MKKLVVLAIAAVAALVPIYSQANAGQSKCEGGLGDFTITDAAGNFIMAVETSDDDVFAPFGSGHKGPFIVFGLESTDTICGSNRGGVIYGGPGHDILRGSGGEDVMHGGPGNDFIDGQSVVIVSLAVPAKTG